MHFYLVISLVIIRLLIMRIKQLRMPRIFFVIIKCINNKVILTMFFLVLAMSLIYIFLLRERNGVVLSSYCYDNNMKVEVHQTYSPLLSIGADISLWVFSPKDSVIFNSTFDSLDMWDDAIFKYTEVICTPNSIKVGKGYWDNNGYYVVRKSQLKMRLP